MAFRDRLARAVAALNGETLTDAVRVALAERLARERRRRGEAAGLADQLEQLGQECAALPDLTEAAPTRSTRRQSWQSCSRSRTSDAMMKR